VRDAHRVPDLMTRQPAVNAVLTCGFSGRDGA
jgi:hypothetical protein